MKKLRKKVLIFDVDGVLVDSKKNMELSWNEVQNHCLFERRPNKYDPDTVMWLNLYKF